LVTIKLFSPWHNRELSYSGVIFSPFVDLDDADGAIWEYFPTDSTILEYSGVKALYCCEPSWHSQYRSKLIKNIIRNLDLDERLNYANPDPKYRVPHITNYKGDHFYNNKNRNTKAVAIVSNSGGRLGFLNQSMRLRNQLVTNKFVDLFGKKSSWSKYSWNGLKPWSSYPHNYKGELNWEGSWLSEEQVKFMSQYKAAVCLENISEPFYFTEKFFNAARAGCIPIYHAHPSVRDGILQGAKWIDPIDFNFNSNQTLQAALDTSLEDFQNQNYLWLQKPEVKATGFDGVWSTLGNIFKNKCNS